MFHPVGSLPPSVYWRRRIAVLAALVVLVALTIYALRPGGSDSPRASAVDHTTSPTQTTPTTSIAAAPISTPPTTPPHSSAQQTRSPAGTSSSPAAPAACDTAKLKIAAVVGQSSYHVGDQPVLMLQVTNPGTKSCVQDLADSQVELRVYNGESRVWGSHDCQIEPGTSPSTLLPGQSVRVSITWSGLSSQPQCAGTRQRVGAGTYTLYALLAGHLGTAAVFAIS
jgi:hypothetical protein